MQLPLIHPDDMIDYVENQKEHESKMEIFLSINANLKPNKSQFLC